MPVTRTATRALRKSKRREQRNTLTTRRIKYLIKAVKKGIEGKAPSETVLKKFQELTKVLDKAAKKNVIHANKAARLKSRLAQKINKAQSPDIQEEKPVKKAKPSAVKKSTKKTSKKSKK